MSKNVAMFVDVANMYYAARGQEVDVDYVALLKHAAKGRDLIRAYAYTGLDPENENQRKFIDFLAKNGYKPVIKDIRKFGDGRMKANLDIELVVDLFRLADRMDIAVIVSGDGDFAPAIKALQDKGVRCEVISFKPNTSSDLIAVADEFMDIMKVASISRKKGAEMVRDSAMSAPEMPAKEVTPEFGFREASPSVAAAALAALRGGTAAAPTNGRRTRGGTGRRAAVRVEEPAETPTAPTAAEAIAETGEEARRRRRRRGGRGRGRSRRDEEPQAEAGAAAEPGEIGWEEFDDLSELDAIPEDREYTFEEADAATLAELGLTPEAAAPAQDAPQEPVKPARRRSTRAKPVTVAGTGETAPDAGTQEPAKPARRRSTRATPADGASAVEAASAIGTPDDAPKPARRRTSRPRPAADVEPTGAETAAPTPRRRTPRAATTTAEAGVPAEADAAGGGQPQGIWSRFRTARGPKGGGSSS